MIEQQIEEHWPAGCESWVWARKNGADGEQERARTPRPPAPGVYIFRYLRENSAEVGVSS